MAGRCVAASLSRSHYRLQTMRAVCQQARLGGEKLAAVASSESSSPSTAQHIEKARWRSAKPYSDIPGPTPIPLLGNTWRFLPVVGDYRIESIDKLTKKLYNEYGPVVKLGGLLGRPDMVFLYDADEIERVFRNEELMPHRPSMPSLNYYKHVLRKQFFGEMAGVIAVHGEAWYRFRSAVQQPMLQPRTARLYVDTIADTADCFVRRCRRIRDHRLEMPDHYLNEIHKWSLESIAKIALDKRLGCLDDEDNDQTQRLIDAVITFFQNVPVLELKAPLWRVFPTPAWRRYIRALDTIKETAMKHINLSLRELSGRDVNNLTADSSLLQRVLAINNDPKIAAVLALDMFLVGIDTTSTAVSSILYQLSQHQDKQNKLFEEVQRFLPTKDSPVTAQKLEQMSYLKAVIKETLRMYPVVIGNGRTMTRDTVVGGYQVPQGVQIVFQHYVISNQSRYFAHPDRFEPERWIKGTAQPIHPFASLPFGYGRRMCLGKRFADLEIQTVIAKMVQSFVIEFHYPPLDYHIHPMYTPNGPLNFRLIDRI